MQIDLWTLALQAINFLVLVWLSARFLYRPVRRVMAERKALAEKALADARAAQSEAEAAAADYRKRKAELEADRQRLEAELHARMKVERDQELAAARKQATALLDEAREAAAEARRQELDAARTDVIGLAVALARRLLEASGAEPGQDLRDRIGAYVEALPAAQRDELRRDFAEPGAEVTVVTAQPLDDGARAQWRGAVRSWFGDVATGFAEDPALLGGVEVRLPHATIGFSWKEELRRARETILEPADA